MLIPHPATCLSPTAYVPAHAAGRVFISTCRSALCVYRQVIQTKVRQACSTIAMTETPLAGQRITTGRLAKISPYGSCWKKPVCSRRLMCCRRVASLRRPDDGWVWIQRVPRPGTGANVGDRRLRHVHPHRSMMVTVTPDLRGRI